MWLWIVFHLLLFGMLALDLGVFHRRAHEVKIREALVWTAVWVLVALLFTLVILYTKGTRPALHYVTAYLVEKSLSVDNIFVFLVIFSYFDVPARLRHRVLFWGILGALVMRFAFILAGVALLQKFHWLFFAMGAFLVVTGVRLALQKERKVSPEKNLVFRLLRPLTADNGYSTGRFFAKKSGRFTVTQLFVVLVGIETTDVVFAIDSVPAVLAITLDPFVAYTSNVLAILGLRSLFFAVGGLLEMFGHLHYGLATILVFIGAKMLVTDYFKIPVFVTLPVVVVILVVSVASSLAARPKTVDRETRQ